MTESINQVVTIRESECHVVVLFSRTVELYLKHTQVWLGAESGRHDNMKASALRST